VKVILNFDINILIFDKIHDKIFSSNKYYYTYKKVFFMKNIVFYARLIKCVSYLLMFATILGFFIKWLYPEIVLDNPYHIFNLFIAYTFDDYTDVAASVTTMPFLHRILGMIVDSGISVLLIMILWCIAEIMKKFEHNELFSVSMVETFTMMSKYAFCLALCVPINRIILSVIITMHNAPGHRFITASLGSADLFNILLFGVFAVMTHLMQRAAVLQDEQNLTV